MMTASAAGSEGETEVVFGEKGREYHTFGGPSYKMRFGSGSPVSFIGGGGAAVIGDIFTLGASGYGTLPDIDTGSSHSYFHFGYTGPEAGILINRNGKINCVVRLLAGIGWAANRVMDSYIYDDVWSETRYCLVIEPSLEAGVNISDKVKLTAGISWLYAGRFSIWEIFTQDNINGITAVISVRFLIY